MFVLLVLVCSPSEGERLRFAVLWGQPHHQALAS